MNVSESSHGPDDLFFGGIIDSYLGNPRFLRRNWLAVELEETLRNADCRFLLMTAAPGAGKSAFIAQIAHDHPNWPVYFIRRDQRSPFGAVGAHSFLLRIGYQLAALYPELFTPEKVKLVVEQRIGVVDESGEAVGAEVERIIASPFYQQTVRIRQQVERNKGNVVGLRVGEWVVDPRLIPLSDLQNLALIDPATSLLALRPEEKIVILVDALDELRYHHADQTLLQWLTNCPQLPRNIRFVLTSRPPDQALIAFSEKQRPFVQTLTLGARTDLVKKDLEIYVGRLVTEPAVAVSLEQMGLESREFSSRAIAKANDNIGYLDALARGIDQTVSSGNEAALLELLSLHSLPDHLEGLYAFFLRQVRAAVDRQSVEIDDVGEVHYAPAWPAVYKRALGALAVAREPLTLGQIKSLGVIAANEDYLSEALNQLLQFLSVVNGHYRFYHASVAEFLIAPETRENPETADLYVDPVRWHGQIANHYWKAGEGNWQSCDEYGLNHLATHLFESRQRDRLQNLISKAWMEARYAGGGYIYQGFLNDVDLAWQTELAKKDRDVIILARLQMARLIVTQQASLYTEIDLKTLVWLGRKQEALAHARLRTEAAERFRGLVSIYEALREKEQVDIDLLNEAEKVVSAIPDDEPRTEALRDLAAAMAQAGEGRAGEVFAQAEEAVRAIAGDVKRAEALRSLGVALARAGESRATEVFAEAEDTAGAIPYDWRHALALRELGVALAEAGHFAQAEETAHAISYSQPRSEVLSKLATMLAEAGHFAQAEETAHAIWRERERAGALRGLGAALARAGESRATEVFAQAEETARAIPDDGPRVEALRELGAAMARAGGSRATEVFAQAEETAHAITDEEKRAEALRELGAAMARAGESRASEVFAQAEKAARAIQDDRPSALALSNLAAVLTRSGRFAQAEETALDITDEEKRAEALRDLAAAMAEAGESRASEVFAQAEETARAIPDDGPRVEALRELGAAMARAGGSRASEVFAQAEETARAIPGIWGRAEALIDLAAVMAQAGHFAQAEETAHAISDDKKRAKALGYLGVALARAGHFAQAEETARAITDDEKRAEALNNMATVLARSGHLAEAEKTARAITIDRDRVLALIDLAGAMAEAGENRASEVFAQAEETARAITDYEKRARALRYLASALARAGESTASEIFAEAEETARVITDDEDRSSALRYLGVAMAEAGENRASEVFAEAEEAARAITDYGYRALALIDLASTMAEVGESRASEVFTQAEGTAPAITKDEDRALIWCNLAAVMARAGHFAEAEETARAITGDKERAEALIDLAAAMAEAGESRATEVFAQAEETARAVTGNWEHAWTLSNLAGAMARSGRFDQALTTLGSRSLTEFLQALASWDSAFEQQNTGLSVAVLREATGVAGWVNSDWRKIHELLSAPR